MTTPDLGNAREAVADARAALENAQAAYAAGVRDAHLAKLAKLDAMYADQIANLPAGVASVADTRAAHPLKAVAILQKWDNDYPVRIGRYEFDVSGEADSCRWALIFTAFDYTGDLDDLLYHGQDIGAVPEHDGPFEVIARDNADADESMWADRLRAAAVGNESATHLLAGAVKAVEDRLSMSAAEYIAATAAMRDVIGPLHPYDAYAILAD